MEKHVILKLIVVSILFALVGCQDMRSNPEDMDGIFIYQFGGVVYYTIDILNRTSGVIYEYDYGSDPDDPIDDNLLNTDPFTITETGTPWYFSGGPLDNDASFQITHTINVSGFNGDNPASFSWWMDD